MVQIPKTVQLLPVQPKAREGVEVQAQEVWEEDDPTDYPTLVFEPEPAQMLPYLAGYYLRSQIFTALIQSSACELRPDDGHEHGYGQCPEPAGQTPGLLPESAAGQHHYGNQ